MPAEVVRFVGVKRLTEEQQLAPVVQTVIEKARDGRDGRDGKDMTWQGFKMHIVRDPETELMVDVIVTPL